MLMTQQEVEERVHEIDSPVDEDGNSSGCLTHQAEKKRPQDKRDVFLGNSFKGLPEGIWIFLFLLWFCLTPFCRRRAKRDK
jgi:hypothetical protein